MKTVFSLIAVAVLALCLTSVSIADDQKSSKDTHSSKQASSQTSSSSTQGSTASTPSTSVSAPVTTSTATHPSTGSASATSEHSYFADLFTHETIRGMIGTVVYFCLALIFFGVGWKVMDIITPGNLGEELLGTKRANGTPNYALAIVVGAMMLGLSLIIAAAIH